ncbi:hypothetical protein AVEN_100076-1 [Araneus ventricosus]|uniref:Uncharacterized protein n=1 Tax=Araneus ventricosus TaxID=182803 RepID=A0A4Y2MYX9_ARAVE|nr:hypothetical protein AVEN_100076-1 [Araneus ventricosus]
MKTHFRFDLFSVLCGFKNSGDSRERERDSRKELSATMVTRFNYFRERCEIFVDSSFSQVMQNVTITELFAVQQPDGTTYILLINGLVERRLCKKPQDYEKREERVCVESAAMTERKRWRCRNNVWKGPAKWDNALKFLIDYPIASKENDFDNLAEVLIKKFEKKQRQFSTISQKQNQSVKDLANEVSMVADKYVNVENTNQNCDSILKENLKLTRISFGAKL